MSAFDEYTKAEQIREATDLLAAFRDTIDAPLKHPENCVVDLGFPFQSTTALVIGELDAVAYRPTVKGDAFFHRFQKNNRPLLLVSFDGSQIFVSQGRYKFTDRGFLR